MINGNIQIRFHPDSIRIIVNEQDSHAVAVPSPDLAPCALDQYKQLQFPESYGRPSRVALAGALSSLYMNSRGDARGSEVSTLKSQPFVAAVER